MLPKSSKSIRTALKKTRGMLDKIETMLDEDRYCADIAQQVNAAIGLLKSLNREVLISHLHTCGAHRLGSKVETERQEFIDELLHIANITKRA
jgi:DNA-binding FrmR family transcriptional regulator